MVQGLEIEFTRFTDGADDRVEALVGTDRRAVVGDVRHAHQQRVQRRLMLAKLLLQLGRPRAYFLGLGTKRRALLRRSGLERCADAVPLGAQLVDLGPQAPRL